MDMDFKWGGDASIVLAINPVVGPKLPVQVPIITYGPIMRSSRLGSLYLNHQC